MKLTWRIVLKILLLMSVMLAIWVLLFYNKIIDEFNDEVDNSLELISENIINSVLLGRKLSHDSNGINNTYYLDSLTAEQVSSVSHREYLNEEIFITQKDEYEPSRVLKTVFKNRNGDYLRLTVAVPTVDKEDLNEFIIQWIINLYIVLLLVITIVSFWVLGRTMKPLYRLLGWLDNYDVTHGVGILNNPTDIEEFAILNNAIMRTAQKNHQIYEQQERFIGNASHEIQTPLAICSNRLELLMETQLTEEQFAEVAKIQNTISYISKLNRELLLLTKIDSGQFNNVEDVDLAKIIAKSIEDAAIVYSYKGIVIDNKIRVPIILKMNTTLATILITNLIKNAFLHNVSGGLIETDYKNNTLMVANNCEYGELDGNLIFNRFYQGSKKEGSLGLGLSLIKSITGIYGYQVSYAYSDNLHRFYIKF